MSMNILTRLGNKLIRELYYRNPLNVYLGKKIYKNDSGVMANIIGNYVMHRDRIHSNIELKLEEKAQGQIETLKKNGWVNLGKLYSNEEVLPIKQKLDNIASEESIPDSYRLEKSSQIGNHEFYNQFPEVKLLINEEIISLITSFYQSHFQIVNAHIYRTFSIPESKMESAGFEAYGSTEFWHNDGTTVESIKLFVLLDDVDEEAGPLHIISLEDSNNIIAGGFRKDVEGKSNGIIEKTKNISRFTGKAGTALLANPNTCLHRGDIPDNGRHRDMLVFYISCNSKPLKPDWEVDATRHQYLGISRLFS